MTRITYTEVNGLLKSKPMLCKTDNVIVSIDVKNLEAVITSLNTVQPLKALKSTKDLNNLKKSVKQALNSLGVVFKDEVRPGRKVKEVLKLQEEQMKDDLNV